MAGINYFYGRSEAWLLDRLKQTQEDLAAGRTRVSWQAGESNSASRIMLSPQITYQMLWEALSKIDCVTYPPEQGAPITRTKAVFL
jgi:hypothetical protein